VLMYFRGVKKSAWDVSLSDSIETDGEGGSLCLMDVVYLEDDMLERVSRAELRQKLGTLVEENLDDRERRIIRLRYGLEGEAAKTQREVAEICGISRSYVSRIEKKALEKLRDAFGERPE
ncbi:MAG: sigma-70 family RNA polymerase sigma factor, partial [Clostridiales bacterium]|nr:sigma-70 family RNA polymerase sigma factor [Clostridiales bacterium]